MKTPKAGARLDGGSPISMPGPLPKVVVALARLSQGNTSNVKGVGGGVSEIRIDFGLGYRVYLGRDGEAIVILLGGGTKRRQQRDITAAQACWQAYKNRKRN